MEQPVSLKIVVPAKRIFFCVVLLVFFLAGVWGTLPFTIAAQATHNENLMLRIRTVMAIFNISLKCVFFNMYGLVGIAYCTLLIWGFGSAAMCALPYRAMKRQGYLACKK